MTANDHLLTEGIETEENTVRHGPYVSGFPLAEWSVWNWWRIRWEFNRPTVENAARRWDFAHRMQTVGDGYVWPNITIFSDGLNSFLTSRPSPEIATVLFRYVGAYRREEVSAAALEESLFGFVIDSLSRLENSGLRTTNLHYLWKDLQAELADPELSRHRKLEAQLGFDPGLDGALSLSDTRESVRAGEVEAWRMGKQIAQRIREQERLGGSAISNERLAEFAGTTQELISNTRRNSPNVSFVLKCNDAGARVSLRSQWETGRRFDLARLVGDYSEEKQNEVAEHFSVSPMTIQALLVNHGRINREDAPGIYGRGGALMDARRIA